MTDIDIPIWSDPDVQRICDFRDGRPWPRFGDFNAIPTQLDLVKDFVEADQNAGNDAPASAFREACLAGIRVVEGLDGIAEPGWLKFFTYFTEVNNSLLWDSNPNSDLVAPVAEWVVEIIERFGWGSDGNSSALGQRHSNAMATAAEAGGGLRHNAATGELVYGNGDRARQAAGVGAAASVSMSGPAEESPGDVDPFARAMDELQSRIDQAEGGDQASQLVVAGLQAQAREDGASAMSLFEQAAQLGDVDAMMMAADAMQKSGDGRSARFWFESAASAGVPDAFRGLARLAESAGDTTLEREWSRRGAEVGEGWCMGNHAYFLLVDAQQATPETVGPILESCYSYATRASALGHVNAMYSAGISGAALGRQRKARDWLDRAETGGHPNARAMMVKLGLA